MRRVRIRYHRPPDQLDVYEQELILDRPDVKVALLERLPAERALSLGGRSILEPGAPVLWFVFPDAWYDVGRFHRADGTFTGYYTNLISPPRLAADVWELYDLCLDLWLDVRGDWVVLDRDEFDEAVDRGWIDPDSADRARQELSAISERVREGRWPPPIVRRIDLDRARSLTGR